MPSKTTGTVYADYPFKEEIKHMIIEIFFKRNPSPRNYSYPPNPTFSEFGQRFQQISSFGRELILDVRWKFVYTVSHFLGSVHYPAEHDQKFREALISDLVPKALNMFHLGELSPDWPVIQKYRRVI